MCTDSKSCIMIPDTGPHLLEVNVDASLENEGETDDSGAESERGPKSPGVVNSVVHALSVLRFLAHAGTPYGATAIARAIGQSPSSTFNICRTLTAENFLHFDASRKVYTLGPGAIELAEAASDGERAFSRAREAMERIVSQFSVTSALWQLTGEERLVLKGIAEGRGMMRIQMTVGARIPAMSGAMGRCYAAMSDLDEKQLRKKFKAVRWQNGPDFDVYLAEVEETGKKGWAIDPGEFIRGVTTIAAPIFDTNGIIRFMLANSSFTGQLDSDDLERVGEATLKSAETMHRLIFRQG